jgi:hypothetical protein
VTTLGCLFRAVPLIFSLLVAFQLLSEAPAFAEWLLVDGNNKAKIYVDSETIIRNGERVSVSVLDDLRTAQTRWFKTYLSSRGQEEHDCSQRDSRSISLEIRLQEEVMGGVDGYRENHDEGFSCPHFQQTPN